MEAKLFSISFIFLTILLSFPSISHSIPSYLQYQTLRLQSLPKAHSLSLLAQQEQDEENSADTTQTRTRFTKPGSEPKSVSQSEPRSEPRSEPKSEPKSTAGTFSVRVHHVDSLSASFHNATKEKLFHRRLHRDAVRARSIFSLVAVRTNDTTATAIATSAAAASPRSGFSSSVVSGLAQGSGEYFTRIGVGTPAKNAYMVLDTGSDVVWIQCSPCKKCYNQSDPIFDPTKSTSFTGLPCDSPLCRRLDSPGCNNRNSCLYQVSYGDGSFTFGEFSTETLTFQKTRVSNVALGCGHDNEGLFVGAAGLLSLGRGRLSFPSQTGDRFGRKFSYCLADLDPSATSKPSSIIFGDAAVPRNVVFTPMLTNPRLDTFYYIGLIGISVGGVRVPGITASLFELDAAGKGGVIIDSGTSVTRLTQPAYVALRDAFRAGTSHLKRAPKFSLFDTCFDLSGETAVEVPTVVLHFTNADVLLTASNYLFPVDSNDKYCFAFAGTESLLSIIGNIQQQGFRVVFDLAGTRIGFGPDGCA